MLLVTARLLDLLYLAGGDFAFTDRPSRRDKKNVTEGKEADLATAFWQTLLSDATGTSWDDAGWMQYFYCRSAAVVLQCSSTLACLRYRDLVLHFIPGVCIHFIFIYWVCLFNDIACCWYYMVLNDRRIGEQWMGRDIKRNGRTLVWGSVPEFLWTD